ncbi:MAG: ABC transporter permease subunit, partial [Spirochaetales bacterium]|nr:ABC transporter permease subunit [Spirochaetales bacterium]
VLISGRGDLLCGGISITEERKQSINFAVPTFKAGVVAVVRKPENTDGEHLRYSSIEELNKKGIKIGMGTGMSFETLCRQRVPKASILYFNTFTDMANSIKKGKIDAAILDKPSADMLIANVGGVGCFPELFDAEDYAVIFPKTAKGAALRDEFNVFLNKIKADGRLAEMQKIWMGNDESLMTLPVLPKTGKRGTLRLAVDPVSEPFSYIKKGQPVGYDIAYITAFCQENGYGLDISTMDFTAIIPAITTSGYDFAATGISVTPERQESLYFSEATYNGGAVVLVKKEINKAVKESSDTKNNFFSSLAVSFEKTFIRESRWKLILSGIGVTVLISILSAILGTIMGFLICIMRRSNNKILDIIAIVYIRIMQGTPTVVLLMILFYIVFAKTGLNGVMVAIIGFGMNFAAYTSEMMRTGIEAVDKGQTEAALALGYTKVRAFFKVVFPQAAQHFLPVFQGEFISLVKMTSVVGYIAIQDLTKAGDIIRSRTYEAFFPLITIAVIYFVIAWLLTRVLVAVQNAVDPKKRKRNIK